MPSKKTNKAINKRGWLLIVESVIAILILFGFVFAAMAKYAQESKMLREEQSLYDVANILVLKAEKNETARGYIFNNQLHSSKINKYLTDEITRMKLNVEAEAKVCEVKSTCLLEDGQKDIYSSEIIMTNSSTIKKFKVFVWQK